MVQIIYFLIVLVLPCYYGRESPVFIDQNITFTKLSKFRERIRQQKLLKPQLPSIYDLPDVHKDNHEEGHSILVNYCVTGSFVPSENEYKLSLKGKDTMINQLSEYREAGEHNLNIHVVITTLINDWSVHLELFNPNSSFNFIFRTQNLLPVAFVLNNYAYPLRSEALVVTHRYIFLELVNKYDFFLVQENDCLVKLRNMHYFIKYFKLLGEGKGVFIPTFLDYELPSNYVTVDQGMKHIDPAIYFLALPDEMHLVLENGVLYWNTFRPAHEFTIYSQWMIEKLSTLESWFGDEVLYFEDLNVHYRWMGMHRFYRAVIPVKELLGAFTHYSSNRYINEVVEKDIRLFVYPKLNELKSFFNWLFEQATNANPSFAKEHFRRYRTNYNLTVNVNRASDFTDMETCLNSGGYYQIGFIPDTNHYNLTLESSSITMVNYGKCMIESSVPRQDLVACRTLNMIYSDEDVKVPFDRVMCNPPEYLFPLTRNRKFI